jgi:hypothetical protein
LRCDTNARVGIPSPDRHPLVEPVMSARDSETSAWARRGRRGEAERLAHAESSRIDADTARREADLDRLEAEAATKRAEAMRVVAQTTAMKLATERDEAIAKASELEDELAVARDRLAEQPAAEPDPTDPTDPTDQDDLAATEPVPAPPEEPRPAPRKLAPEPAAPESIRFAPRGHRPALTILLALASLSAAGAAVYLAYRDQLTSGPGLLSAAATVVLAVAVGRMGRGATTVTIERGMVHVTAGRSSERADLTSPTTLVELIGQPGERDRTVMLIRKTRGALSIDESMVDLDAFIDAVRRWRPGL